MAQLLVVFPNNVENQREPFFLVFSRAIRNMGSKENKRETAAQ
jgi:hypothetical protein